MAAPDPEKIRKWGQLAGIGPFLVASVVAGWWVGRWLDDKLGTSPWIMVAGVLLGTAGGFIELFRILKGLGESGRKRARRAGGAADVGGSGGSGSSGG